MRVSMLAVGVPAPVRAGDGLQLDRLDALRAGAVRAAAEVGERAVRVEADGLERVLGVGVATRSSMSSTL